MARHAFVYGALVAAAPFVLFAVGAVGVGTWRAALVALMLGAKPRHAGRLSLGMALGMVAGGGLSFPFGPPGHFLPEPVLDFGDSDIGIILPGALQDSTVSSLPLATLVTAQAVWLVIILLSAFIMIKWIDAAANIWFEAALASASPRPILISSVVMVTLSFTLWFCLLAVFYLFQQMMWRLPRPLLGVMGQHELAAATMPIEAFLGFFSYFTRFCRL